SNTTKILLTATDLGVRCLQELARVPQLDPGARLVASAIVIARIDPTAPIALNVPNALIDPTAALTNHGPHKVVNASRDHNNNVSLARCVPRRSATRVTSS